MLRSILNLMAYLAGSLALSYAAGGLIGYVAECNGTCTETAGALSWSVCMVMFAVLCLVGKPGIERR